MKSPCDVSWACSATSREVGKTARRLICFDLPASGCVALDETKPPLLCGTSHRHTALSIQWHSLSQPEACTRNHNAHHTSVKWNKDLTRHLANHTKNVTRRWFLVVTNVPLLVILGVRHPLRVSCRGLAVLSVTEGYYRSVIRYSNRHTWTGI